MSRDIIKSGLHRIVYDEHGEPVVLGRGKWGTVYLGEQLHFNGSGELIGSHEIAIKTYDPLNSAIEQAKHRNVDKYEVMRNEAPKLTPGARLVPRAYYEDENREPYIVMPVYGKNFASLLSRSDSSQGDESYAAREDRMYLGNGLTMEQIIDFVGDITTAQSEYNLEYERAHPDPHPYNFVVEDIGKPESAFKVRKAKTAFLEKLLSSFKRKKKSKNQRLLLTDFGSTTVLSYGKRSKDPRDNMGIHFVMAPEQQKGHPNESSGYYSVGSVFYRMFTGEYPLEKRVAEIGDPDNPDDYKGFVSKKGKEELEVILREEVSNKNIPYAFRRLLTKLLHPDPEKRPQDNEEFQRDVSEAIKKYRASTFNGRARRAGLAGLVAAAVAALVFAPSAIDAYKNQRDLRRELELKESWTNYRQKLGAITLHAETGRTFSNTSDLLRIGLGSISGWLKEYKDPKTAYSAYVDADAVVEAIHRANGKEDFESIREHLRDIAQEKKDNNLEAAFSEIWLMGSMDNWAIRASYENMDRVKELRQEAEKRYEEKIKAEAEEQRKIKEVLKLSPMGYKGLRNSPMFVGTRERSSETSPSVTYVDTLRGNFSNQKNQYNPKIPGKK